MVHRELLTLMLVRPDDLGIDRDMVRHHGVGHDPLLEAEILLLFAQYVVHGLVLVVKAVKLSHAGIRLGIVLAILALGFAFLIAAFQELIQVLQIPS